MAITLSIISKHAQKLVSLHTFPSSALYTTNLQRRNLSDLRLEMPKAKAKTARSIALTLSITSTHAHAQTPISYFPFQRSFTANLQRRNLYHSFELKCRKQTQYCSSSSIHVSSSNYPIFFHPQPFSAAPHSTFPVASTCPLRRNLSGVLKEKVESKANN